MAQANIKAVITADDRASATLGSFGNNVDALGSKITGALKVAGVAAFAAVAAGIVGATKASWDQVDAVQQATVGLKAYEKDGAKVNAVLSDLIKYARSDLGVLFNRKDLFQSAQSLKLMGDNTNDLVNHVQILSRSVGLGLSNWDDLNLIVGRVGSTGRLTGEDFDNLTKAGFRLDPAIRNTDQNFTTLFDHLSKGIPADALAGQADTIQGKFIRLETAFRGVGDAILGVNQETGKFNPGGLGDGITKTIGAITEALKNPEFKQGLKDTMAGIAEGFRIFKEIMAQVLEVMKPVFDYIRNNKEAWDVLRMALIAIIVIIVGLIVLIGVGLVGAFALIMAIINAAIFVVTAVINAITWLGNAIAGVIWWFVVLYTSVANAMTQFTNSVINGINNAINFFNQLRGNISNAMSQFANAVSNGVSSAINWFAALPGNILGAIGNLGNLLFNAGRSMIDGLVSGITSVANAPAKAMKDVLNNIQKLLPHSPAKEGPFSGKGWTLYSGMAISEALAQGISASGSQPVDAMSGVVSGVSGAIGSNGALNSSNNSGTMVTQNNPTPNITIQVGAFMGTQTDARKLAKMVFESYQEIQAMGGVA